MLSLKDSLAVLKKTKALLEGHFVLSSGLHSPQYVQCAKLLSYPKKSEEFCKSLSTKIEKKYNTTLWMSLPDRHGILGDVTTMIGTNNVNISSVEMVEKTKRTINFRFNLIIQDLKNFTKLISELKQKEYNFKIIRHKNKKYAFFKRFFSVFKKN